MRDLYVGEHPLAVTPVAHFHYFSARIEEAANRSPVPIRKRSLCYAIFFYPNLTEFEWKAALFGETARNNGSAALSAVGRVARSVVWGDSAGTGIRPGALFEETILGVRGRHGRRSPGNRRDRVQKIA